MYLAICRTELNERSNSLREVYSWYLGNKHSLASRPVSYPFHFSRLYKKSFKTTISIFQKFGREKSKSADENVQARPVTGVSKLGHVSSKASKALDMVRVFMHLFKSFSAIKAMLFSRTWQIERQLLELSISPV